MAPETQQCDGPTGALSASDAAPANLLFVLDRSVAMAGDFQGAPRWQMTGQALSHAFGSRASQVTLGALLYPSANQSECTGPDWLCALQQPAMCSVSEMSAADQVAFQPGSAALSTLLDDEGLYSPLTIAAGVPLAETLQRADAALAGRMLSGRTSVVILASGMPTCQWNAAEASATLARWRTERGVQTHVVALPGSPPGTAAALAALAEAGGTGQVHAPRAIGALEATLQSIVVDSLSSCTLQLDPPAPDPSAVRLLVTEDGVERLLPQTSATGEALWTLSADGRTVTLLGSACDAARGGIYEALRVVLGCARP
jgi:hypothetical protein